MSMRMNFDKLELKFREAAEKVPDKVDDAVQDHVEKVFEQTQVRVPRESGRLAATGKVEKTTHGEKKSAKITYGEPGEGKGVVDYAAAVHEILHAKHVPPTGAKFVEQPLIESIDTAKEKTAKAVEKGIKEAFK